MNTHYKDTPEIQDRLFTIGAILTPQEKEVKKTENFA
jgi:hypothetical protein